MRVPLPRPDTLVALGFILVVGLWYSHDLAGSFGWDEFTYARHGVRIIDGQPYFDLDHPPFGKFWFAAGEIFTGLDEVGARSPIVLLSLGVLWLTFDAARRVAPAPIAVGAMAAVGLTWLYAAYSVQALLEIPFALLLILATGMIVNPIHGFASPKLWSAGFGALFVAAVATKVLAIVIFPVFVIAAWRRLPMPIRHRFWPNFCWGGICAAVVLLLPFAVRTPPATGALWGISYDTPLLGGPLFLAHELVRTNLALMDAGNGGYVAGRFYDDTPVWSYGAWIWEYCGPFWTIALALVFGVAISRLLRRSGGIDTGWLVIAPLVGMSLVANQIPRYLVSLLPVMAVAASRASFDLVRWLGIRGRSWRLVLVVCAAVLAAGPLQPFRVDLESSIHPDSRLADAAATLIGRGIPEGSSIASRNHNALWHYLTQGGSGAVRVIELDYESTEQEAGVRNGTISFVVDYEPMPYTPNNSMFQYLRADATEIGRFHTTSTFPADLVVFDTRSDA